MGPDFTEIHTVRFIHKKNRFSGLTCRENGKSLIFMNCVCGLIFNPTTKKPYRLRV